MPSFLHGCWWLTSGPWAYVTNSSLTEPSLQSLSKTGRPLVRVWWATQGWIVRMGPVSCNSWSLMEPATHLSLFPSLPYMHQELMKKKFNSLSEQCKLEYSIPSTEHLINSNLHECVSYPDNRPMSTESLKLINFKYSEKKKNVMGNPGASFLKLAISSSYSVIQILPPQISLGKEHAPRHRTMKTGLVLARGSISTKGLWHLQCPLWDPLSIFEMRG